MEYKDARKVAIAPEVRRDGRVELRGIRSDRSYKAERRVYTLDFLVPISGPQCPRYEFGPISRGRESWLNMVERFFRDLTTSPTPQKRRVEDRDAGVFGRIRDSQGNGHSGPFADLAEGSLTLRTTATA